MIYFEKDYIDFFTGLEANNTKEWFDSHKKTYENKVKKPFHAFIDELIKAHNELGTPITITGKEATMRINRDIRFSNDKSPYKIHMAAMVSTHGKKNSTHPGMFIEANHHHVRLYTGSHDLEKQDLYNVRQHIAYNLDEFGKLIEDKKFKDTFGEIRGEKNKIILPEFKEDAALQPLIFNKSYYYFANFEPGLLLTDKLVSKIIEAYKIAMPLNRFFETALGHGKEAV